MIGDWRVDRGAMKAVGRVYEFGGDTITARVVESAAPARIDSSSDMRTEFGRQRWAELGYEASIGAPIFVEGNVWGIVTASRTQPGDTFPPGAEQQLADFAALVAQSIVNAEARRETAALVAEQSALRRIATLVAGGKPQVEVVDEVTSDVGKLFGATSVMLVRWEGTQDEVIVVGSWTARDAPPIEPGTRHHPGHESATIRVLETGFASRSDDPPAQDGGCSMVSAPVIVNAALVGALSASRPAERRLPRRRGGQAPELCRPRGAIDRERARAVGAPSIACAPRSHGRRDARAARAEPPRRSAATARVVSVVLRLAAAKLPSAPDAARTLIAGASEELTLALEELRDLARGLHPAVLTKHGLEPALEALASRAPLPVRVSNEVESRLPAPVEAAVYYVVSESLTNVAKYAPGFERSTCASTSLDGVVRIEVDGRRRRRRGHRRGVGPARARRPHRDTLEGASASRARRGEGARIWAEVGPGRRLIADRLARRRQRDRPHVSDSHRRARRPCVASATSPLSFS